MTFFSRFWTGLDLTFKLPPFDRPILPPWSRLGENEPISTPQPTITLLLDRHILAQLAHRAPRPQWFKPYPPRFRILQEGNFGYIDRLGNITIPPQYEFASEFVEGLAIIIIAGQVGYINTLGKVVIPPQFEGAQDFSQGLAAVMVNGYQGYINKKGQWAIAPQFTLAEPFKQGLARVKQGEEWFTINQKGQRVNPRLNPQQPQEIPPLFLSYISLTGEIFIDLETNLTLEFAEGLAAIAVEEKWGYLDQEGQFAIAPQFDAAYPFSDGLAAIVLDNKIGYINKQGQWVWFPTC